MARSLWAGVLDRVGRVDPHRVDARRDGRAGLRRRPGEGRPVLFCDAAALGVAVVTALPWLTARCGPSLSATADRPGVRVFAPRAEPGLGTLVSFASLGGIWNGQAVPDSRTTLFAVVSAVVLLCVVAAGLPAVVGRPAAVPLLVLAAVAVVVPSCLATGPGLHLLSAVVDAVPGLGVLRDGQKWVALAMPGYALAGAGAVVTLGRWLGFPGAALACCLVLILALPDLAWGCGAMFRPCTIRRDGRPSRRRSTISPARSRCCPPAPCGGFRGRVRRRYWIRCRAGSAAMCWPPATWTLPG